MIYLWLILLLILGLVITILFAPLKIIIEYIGNKLSITFRCLIFKFTVDDKYFSKRKSKGKVKEKKKPKDSDEADVIGKIKLFKEGYGSIKSVLFEVLSLLKDHAEFTGLYLRVRYGTGDAAITGIVYGAIWSLVGSIYALLCRLFKVDFPKIELEPVFGEKAFELEAEGIIKTKLVHIITASLRSVKIYSKHKKEKGADK